MGMYTTLRCICEVKEEYREYIEAISSREKRWKDFIDEMPFVKDLAKCERASFIPGGVMTCYNEDKFSKKSFSEFDVEFGLWNFCCDLKNYDEEIEQFVYGVLPHLCNRINFCAYWYEEDDYPNIVLEDNTTMRKPRVDGVSTHLILIEHDLEKEIRDRDYCFTD